MSGSQPGSEEVRPRRVPTDDPRVRRLEARGSAAVVAAAAAAAAAAESLLLLLTAAAAAAASCFASPLASNPRNSARTESALPVAAAGPASRAAAAVRCFR